MRQRKEGKEKGNTIWVYMFWDCKRSRVGTTYNNPCTVINCRHATIYNYSATLGVILYYIILNEVIFTWSQISKNIENWSKWSNQCMVLISMDVGCGNNTYKCCVRLAHHISPLLVYSHLTKIFIYKKMVLALRRHNMGNYFYFVLKFRLLKIIKYKDFSKSMSGLTLA